MARKRELGNVRAVPMTVDVALRVARVDPDMPKPDQESQIRAKIDAGELGDEAIRALKRGGYRVS